MRRGFDHRVGPVVIGPTEPFFPRNDARAHNLCDKHVIAADRAGRIAPADENEAPIGSAFAIEHLVRSVSAKVELPDKIPVQGGFHQNDVGAALDRRDLPVGGHNRTGKDITIGEGKAGARGLIDSITRGCPRGAAVGLIPGDGGRSRCGGSHIQPITRRNRAAHGIGDGHAELVDAGHKGGAGQPGGSGIYAQRNGSGGPDDGERRQSSVGDRLIVEVSHNRVGQIGGQGGKGIDHRELIAGRRALDALIGDPDTEGIRPRSGWSTGQTRLGKRHIGRQTAAGQRDGPQPIPAGDKIARVGAPDHRGKKHRLSAQDQLGMNIEVVAGLDQAAGGVPDADAELP